MNQSDPSYPHDCGEEVFVRNGRVVIARRDLVVLRPAGFVRRAAVSAVDFLTPKGAVCQELRSIGARYGDEAVSALKASAQGINWNAIDAAVRFDEPDPPDVDVSVLGVLIHRDRLEDAVREADFMVAGARVANVNIGLSPWVAFGDSSGRVAVVKGEERKGTRPGPHASGFTGGVFEAEVLRMPLW